MGVFSLYETDGSCLLYYFESKFMHNHSLVYIARQKCSFILAVHAHFIPELLNGIKCTHFNERRYWASVIFSHARLFVGACKHLGSAIYSINLLCNFFVIHLFLGVILADFLKLDVTLLYCNIILEVDKF